MSPIRPGFGDRVRPYRSPIGRMCVTKREQGAFLRNRVLTGWPVGPSLRDKPFCPLALAHSVRFDCSAPSAQFAGRWPYVFRLSPFSVFPALG